VEGRERIAEGRGGQRGKTGEKMGDRGEEGKGISPWLLMGV